MLSLASIFDYSVCVDIAFLVKFYLLPAPESIKHPANQAMRDLGGRWREAMGDLGGRGREAMRDLGGRGREGGRRGPCNRHAVCWDKLHVRCIMYSRQCLHDLAFAKP